MPGPARRGLARSARAGMSRAPVALAAALPASYDRSGETYPLSNMTMQLANRTERLGNALADANPLGLAFGERWFAVSTQPVAEARAQRNLENQGFRTFM